MPAIPADVATVVFGHGIHGALRAFFASHGFALPAIRHRRLGLFISLQESVGGRHRALGPNNSEALEAVKQKVRHVGNGG